MGHLQEESHIFVYLESTFSMSIESDVLAKKVLVRESGEYVMSCICVSPCIITSRMMQHWASSAMYLQADRLTDFILCLTFYFSCVFWYKVKQNIDTQGGWHKLILYPMAPASHMGAVQNKGVDQKHKT